MKKREMEILELLTEHERMDVSEIADCLGVSQVTIRKDLADLEKRWFWTTTATARRWRAC